MYRDTILDRKFCTRYFTPLAKTYKKHAIPNGNKSGDSGVRVRNAATLRAILHVRLDLLNEPGSHIVIERVSSEDMNAVAHCARCVTNQGGDPR